MRDPARIDRILAALGEVWHRHPDMRLGQLVSNLAPTGAVLFYIEDDVIEQGIATEPWITGVPRA